MWLSPSHVHIKANRLQHDFVTRKVTLQIALQEQRWQISHYQFDEAEKGWRPMNPRGKEEAVLIQHLSKGHCEEASSFLQKSVTLDASVEHSFPLTLAITRQCHLGLIKALVNRGADVNAGYGRIVTTAIRTGNMELLSYMIDQGADLSRFFSGRGVQLGAAVAYPQLLRLLIEHGADVNQTSMIDTPLIRAVSQGSIASVRLLLSHGADPSIEPRYSKSAWQLARELSPKMMYELRKYIDQCQDRPEVCSSEHEHWHFQQ